MNEPTLRRVRLGQPGDGREGRTGCVLTGALLGIIVGATFAFYGLPPILRHFYGEKEVLVGERRTVSGVTVSLVEITDPCAVTPGRCRPGTVVVSLLLFPLADYDLPPSRFQLEVEGVADWIRGAEVVIRGKDGPAFQLPAGSEEVVDILFPLPAGTRLDEARAVHLTSPRVRVLLVSDE